MFAHFSWLPGFQISPSCVPAFLIPLSSLASRFSPWALARRRNSRAGAGATPCRTKISNFFETSFRFSRRTLLNTRSGSGADVYPGGFHPSFRPAVAGKSPGERKSLCIVRFSSQRQLHPAELRRSLGLRKKLEHSSDRRSSTGCFDSCAADRVPAASPHCRADCSCNRARVRAGLGRRPAASPPHATVTRRRCCPTARCSSQAVDSCRRSRERGTLRSGERDLDGHRQPRHRTL